jgi:hypothetical protein
VKLIPPFVQRSFNRRADRFITTHGYISFDTRKYYAEDGLFTIHDDGFRNDPGFREAYARGIEAGQGVDPHFEWRIHIALWAAATALGVPGDFIECGVNAGFTSSAIMRALDWAKQPRRYYLVDTFKGPVMEQTSPADRDRVRSLLDAGAYVTDLDRVRANFAEWPNAVVVQGAVPEVLPGVPAERIAFLHIDMNAPAPECAALEYFWSKLSPGAVVLLDDYVRCEYPDLKGAFDATARQLQARILSLPTGQGLIAMSRA